MINRSKMMITIKKIQSKKYTKIVLIHENDNAIFHKKNKNE